MRFTLHIVLLVLVSVLPRGNVSSQESSVFETLGSFEGDITTALDSTNQQMTRAGMKVLSAFEAGKPEGCDFDVRVISFVDPNSEGDLIQLDAQTAPYAIVNRVVLFTDENGGHIAFANPQSIYRTVFHDAAEAAVLADQHRSRMRSVFNTTESVEYGQSRNRGLIGKTMGVMAGGPFRGKLENLYVIPNSTVADVSNQIQSAFADGEGKWGLEVGFRYDVEGLGATIIGIAGRQMEAKSFSIVGAGSDKTRDGLSCPGTAYGAAYPLEIVVLQEGNEVAVQLVSAMFRMKMYFEDAGKWAFMKNMGMPGSLTSEMKDRVENATR